MRPIGAKAIGTVIKIVGQDAAVDESERSRGDCQQRQHGWSEGFVRLASALLRNRGLSRNHVPVRPNSALWIADDSIDHGVYDV